MLRTIFETILGCQHTRTTFPQSPRRSGKLTVFQRRKPAHVTCLDCGAEFEYCWRTMRLGKRIYPNPHERITSPQAPQPEAE